MVLSDANSDLLSQIVQRKILEIAGVEYLLLSMVTTPPATGKKLCSSSVIRQPEVDGGGQDCQQYGAAATFISFPLAAETESGRRPDCPTDCVGNPPSYLLPIPERQQNEKR